MSKELYICWIEDNEDFIRSMKGRMEILEIDHDVKFDIDQHYNTANLELIARNIDEDIIFLVDYNLQSAEGDGVDGDGVIKYIREHNSTCHIIFYSSNATQQELRELVSGYPNIVCVIREDLIEKIREAVVNEKIENE